MSVVANVAINVDSRNAVSQLRQVESQAQVTQRAFGALQQAAAAFGAGFALSKVISDVKELDTNLRRLGTVGGDVQALDSGLGNLSKQLDGVANKAELAAASYQALSAGFTETGANLKIVEAATKAAVGGLVDVTSVVEVTTKTLNAYGLSGENAIKVTDSISKAIEFGQVQWSDYTSQLGRVAATAALAGVSIDEINAFVAAATKNGATAEVAFTGLSAALATLLKPSKESADAAAALGIEWNVSGLQARGFSGLLEDLAKKQDANKSSVAELLGSQEALRGVLAANSKAGQDYQTILEGLGGATGKTESDFQKLKGSLENQLKALDTAFKNLSEALGKAFGPSLISGINDVANIINVLADAIKSVPQPVADLIGGLLKLAVAAGAVSSAIRVLNTTTALVTAVLIPMRAAIVASTAASVANTAATAANASAFALYANNARTVAAATTAATSATIGLRAAVLALVNPWALLAAGIIAATVALAGYQSQAQKTAAAAKTGTAGDVVKARNLLVQKGQEVSLLEAQRGTTSGQQRASIDRRLRVLRGEVTGLKSAVAASTADRTTAASGLPTPTAIAQENLGAGGEEDSKAKKEKDKAAEEEKRLLARIRGLQIETEATKQLAFIRGKIAEAEIAGNKELAIRLKGEERNQQIIVDYQKAIEGVTDQREILAIQEKTQAELAAAGIETAIDLEKQRLDVIKEQNDELFKRAGLTPQDKFREGAGAFDLGLPDLRVSEGETKIAELKQQLQELSNPINVALNGANAIGDAFGTAFTDVITGAKSAQQALSEVFKKIADAFIETATQIIAKQIALITFQTILNALGGGGGFSFGGGGPVSGASVFGSGQAGFNLEGFTGASLFAEGGFVTRPTKAIIGEGGANEYVIPADKMFGAMQRYNAGARGEAVLKGASSTEQSGGVALANQPTQINISGGVMQFNDTNYIRQDQVPAIVDQASRAGEARALRKLQQSPSARRKIGM